MNQQTEYSGAATRASVRVPVNWLLASLGLLSSGLLVALIVRLQTSAQGALNATAMALAVISFGAQLLLAAVGYVAGVRQEERSSLIHRETLEAIQTLRLTIESNLSVTSTLSERFNNEFQTILDHVLAVSARAARGPHEAALIEEIGSDLREKALEASVSAPNSPRSRLASAVVKLLHEAPSTVANSVSYSRGMISWLRGAESIRCTAMVSDALVTREELADMVRRVMDFHGQDGSVDGAVCRYIIFPVKPQGAAERSAALAGVLVTWIERFAAELSNAESSHNLA